MVGDSLDIQMAFTLNQVGPVRALELMALYNKGF